MTLDKTQIFSVSDASLLIKGVMESAFSEIRIRGELSQITRAASGHTYMTIKDADAAISAIIWRGAPLPFKPENGMEIIATGKITTYPARSNYQIIVSNMELAGAGAILKMLDERKRKLAAEGLFDAARKRPLPKFPKTIGIITSPTGAVVHDIINRLRERVPVHVLVYPAVVQGEAAAASVVSGLDFFNNCGARPDIIIIARGGGSLEDLLPFSDEILVRAVAASAIPVVSAVGHEPDFMLTDFAADVRAPTPTAAAEIVVPALISVIREIEGLRLRDPRQMVAEKFQRLDDISKILSAAFSQKIAVSRQRILGQQLQSPAAALSNLKNKTDALDARLNLAAAQKLNAARQLLKYKSDMLENLSHLKTLRRGFAIVESNGKIVAGKSDFALPAEIIFADGVVKI
ncbi:MAG: exodeoxyribonuclease VII large subunit [Rickettsiales bacterium]|nr:exodeoxyribonuclease VII large subunit [Rickettsiales bacterium]